MSNYQTERERALKELTKIPGTFVDGHFVPSGSKAEDSTWDAQVKPYQPAQEPIGNTGTVGQQQKADSAYKDRHWVRRSFLNIRKTSESVSRGRASGARYAYTDTTLGGDIAINPQFQYTRFADIKARQVAKVGMGIGRFYYEQIWQNRHDIHIRFGYQMFSNGFVFFSRWYDYVSDRLSRTGRAPGWLYSIGKAAGWYLAFTVPAFYIGMHLFKLAAAYGGQNRYCYVKSGMPQYWGAVNNLVNTVAANMAITLPVSEQMQIDNTGFKGKELLKEKGGKKEVDEGSKPETANWMGQYLQTLPSIYNQSSWDGGFTIDMMKVATRAQRLHNTSNRLLQQRIAEVAEGWKDYSGEKSNSQAESAAQWIERHADAEFVSALAQAGKEKLINGEKWSFENVVKYLWNNVTAFMSDSNDNAASTDRNASESDKKKSTTDIEAAETTSGYWGNRENGDVEDSLIQIAEASLDNGSEWISFRVNGTKSISESFSNSATESEIASAFNSFAKARQKMVFNFAGGSFMGDAVKGVINGAMDMVMGALNGMGLGGLGGIITGAQIDIPKQWDSSSVSLPRLSYELNLRTPYGHPLSIFQSLIVPVLCLIAGTAPLSRGRNALGSPFYCEVYDKGAWQVKMGCIGSLSITRGVGNVPWSRDRQPLGIDVSFEILDMSTTMAVPIMARQTVTDLLSDVITPGKVADDISVGSDTPIDDYLFALSGMGLVEQLYNTNRMSRAWGKYVRGWQTAISKESMMSDIFNHSPLSIFQIFYKGTMRT